MKVRSDLLSESMDSCVSEGSSLDDVDGARAHVTSEEGRAEPRVLAPWALVEKLVRGDEGLRCFLYN